MHIFIRAHMHIQMHMHTHNDKHTQCLHAGYIAVDGTSLTVCDVNYKEGWFKFMLVCSEFCTLEFGCLCMCFA
jgi:riboflavin synthase alpha subunit